MPDYPNPYSPEHLQQMNDILRTTQDAAKLCADCEEVGLNFPDEAEANRKVADIVQRIKRKWFPNSP